MSDFGSPQDWAQGAGAFKNAMDAVKTVIELIRATSANGKKPTPQEQEQIDKAIVEADKASRIADAQTAKALGYELCRCQYPPVAMLTVGFLTRGQQTGEPVHECPKCKRLTSGPYAFHRTAPKSDDAAPSAE